jgi:hypothetical protein
MVDKISACVLVELSGTLMHFVELQYWAMLCSRTIWQ